ncbi:MAG: M3 family metallopeptidase, partial [Burkholderiales bacterium]
MNPLLDFSGLPRFTEVRPQHVTPALEGLLAENRALVDNIGQAQNTPTWDSFVAPLEDAAERLSRAWSVVSHLNAVLNSPALRKVYNANLPKITSYYAELSQNNHLYKKFKTLRKSAAFRLLNRAQRRIVDNELRDFRLGGADLDARHKARFRATQEQLAALSSKFQDNLLDATDAFALYVEDRRELSGIPQDVIAAAALAAKRERRSGWKLTLQAPCWLPVMQYAECRSLRARMYRAYVTRASKFGPSRWDNTPLIKNILKLRREAARLLGFDNYAQYSLATKMADHPKQVLAFLGDLGNRAKPYARGDLRELEDFAAGKLKLKKLHAWDIAYASEKLRVERYAFSDQEVKRYFPETRVLPGMFKLVETLYGVNISPAQAPLWHPDVKFFDITDRRRNPVGRFYLDLYARKNKRGGAWMDDAIARRRKGRAIQPPVAYLTCNFASPAGGHPALFTHDDVITLFHEFGHGLHHLLTRIEEPGVAGI